MDLNYRPPALQAGFAMFFADPAFWYNENPALGAGGSEALIAVGQDKKPPFDVE